MCVHTLVQKILAVENGENRELMCVLVYVISMYIVMRAQS